ncbi:MAG TPA: DUF805 domain-containing protein [Candidatus Wunengus sp. YC61]|uniref:DUF805 domain-containing protein n=1 Tax=Candidatus Wunengus sp. YC61 TaxID=3367698 RepID=UPI004029CB9F
MLGFKEKSQMPQQNQTWAQFFFSFQGCIGRKRFWLHYFLPLALPAIVLSVVINTMSGYQGRSGHGSLVFLVILWPAFAVSTKRWHDRNKSGWWNLIGLIPILGGIWVLVENGFLRGTVGNNQYGSNPLEV